MRLLIATAAGLVLAVAQAPTGRALDGPPKSSEQLYQLLLKSSAVISTEFGIGSGALIDAEKKLVITNFHVVMNTNDVTVFFPSYKPDGELITEAAYYINNKKTKGSAGKVKAFSKKRDLALVQLERLPGDVQPLALASQSAKPGQEVHLIGASGVDLSRPDKVQGTFWRYTPGKVRSVHARRVPTNLRFVFDGKIVESTAPTNPGDSGSPLVNEQGEMVALTSGAFANQVNVSVHVDLSEIQAFLDNFRKGVQEKEAADGAAPLPGELKDPTRPSKAINDRLDARDEAAKPGESAVPQVVLKGRVLAPMQPPTALLEINGRLYSVQKGNRVSGGGRIVFHIVEINRNEVQVEVLPTGDVLLLR